MKKYIKPVILGVVIVLILSQFVINGMKTNPPVIAEPQWDSPETRALVVRACYDCHSNETVWPWYSNVPVISLLVLNDTLEGREKLNFSEWRGGTDPELLGEISETVREGEMPMPIYLVTHPAGRLTDAEKQQMLDGFRLSLGR